MTDRMVDKRLPLEFRQSFALIDGEGKLVAWDRGLEVEWSAARHLIRPGASYAEIVRTLAADPDADAFVGENLQFADIGFQAEARIAGLGTERSHEYRTADGRTILVEERPIVSGEIQRVARDVTGERQAESALADAHRRLEAVGSDTLTSLTETRRTPDGNYVFEPISEATRRMFDLPPEDVGQDALVLFARMEVSAEDNARFLAELEHSAEMLAGLSQEYQIRDGRDRMRWVRHSMMPRREPDGTVIFSGIMRDITREKEAEVALAEAHKRLEAIDSDEYGVLTETRRTPEGLYIFEPISAALCRMLNLPDELVGGDPMLIFSRFERSAEGNARSAALMEHAARTLESFSEEYPIRDGKNRLRWVRQSMMPQREADGTVVFSGVLRDVTREKLAEDQVEMLRSVVVRSSDSIVIFESDPGAEGDSKIVYINEKFTELFGWSADELMGGRTELLSLNRPAKADETIFAALQRDDGEPMELETSDRNGRRFWVEARVATIQKFDNGRYRWAVMAHDISQRRAAHDELLHAKEEAEAGNRVKGEFLANMSHELRTPLNAIIGFTDLIAQGVARTGWKPAYAEYLVDVSESGRHLLDLINTVLDLSKIEAGQLELNLAPVDLCEIMRRSLAIVSGMAHEGGIALSTEIPAECPAIPGDYLALKQVLLNVMSNAIKFTPSGGKVEVALGLTENDAVITVTDTGCGIAEKDLARVTLPFVQAGNPLTRKFGGSGLGLSIARELCRLHGGALEIMSTEGRGTTVRILLPLANTFAS